MKKVLAFLTALTALFCTACNEKNDNINENPPVGDVTSVVSETNISENTETSEVSEENSVISQPAAELKHYTLDDFKKIKVNLNVQETAPPVEFKEYDLSGIEFEAKKSPCKLPENVKIENICPRSKASANEMKMEHEEYCQKFMESYAPILEGEDRPLILYTAFDGENLYYLADYDIVCPHQSHNFEIFRYNPETGENTCIYEYSDGTEGIIITNMMYSDNSLRLFVLDYAEKNSIIKVYNLDEISGSINEIPEKEIPFDYPFEIQSTGYKSFQIGMTLGVSGISLEKENRKMTAYTDKIKLETGINNCMPVLSTDNRMCFLQTDSDVAILHTFDFEKMEKYTTEFESSDANRAYQLGNNVLVHYVYNQKCMYFIPELGAGFVLQEVERMSSLLGNYYPNNLSIDVYDDKLALTNFDIGIYRDFYYSSTFLKDIEYTPVDKNPLKKLCIFDTK